MYIQQYEFMFSLLPHAMSTFCIVYLIFLMLVKGAPKKLRGIGIIQIILCFLYLIGSILKEDDDKRIFLSFFETIYFCAIVIINSEFYRYIFLDIKSKAQEFTAFLKYTPLPPEDKEKIQKKYFEKYPRFEMIQLMQKRLIFICEAVSVFTAIGATILLIS